MTTPAGTARKAAIWARVSSSDGSQTTKNQLDILRQWAADRGLDVVAEFITEDSAWSRNGTKGQEYERQRGDLIEGARMGRYRVVLIWALDRLSRRGYLDLSGVMAKLAEYGCEIWSHQEQWLHTTGPFGEIVVHMLSWIAEQESSRRSERIKAGMARAQREIDAAIAKGEDPGKRIGGRKRGTPDRRKRSTEGYRKAWEPGGARRQALEQKEAEQEQ